MLLLTVTFTPLFAQTGVKISGVVKDITGNPLPAATVILYFAGDSTIAKAAITNTQGYYDMAGIKPGIYFVTATASGFTKSGSTRFTVRFTTETEAPLLLLSRSEKKLLGVTISSLFKKPLIEVYPGKTVFNVENSLTAAGTNGWELLLRSPGISMDNNDNLMMKGKNGVRIYVDGRPLMMNAEGITAFLQGIQASDIEAIEIITQPSSKFEAAGNAGIIQLKLKRNKKTGFNAHIGTGVNFGIRPKFNGNLGISFRSHDINLFANYSNNYVNNQITHTYWRTQADSVFKQQTVQRNTGWVHNIKAGVDVNLSNTSTIGLSYTGNYNGTDPAATTQTNILAFNTGLLNRKLFAGNMMTSHSNNNGINLNYSFADSAGHAFTADLDYGKYNSSRDATQTNRYVSPQEQLLYNHNYQLLAINGYHYYAAKTDYETKLMKGRLNMGFRYYKVYINNAFDLFKTLDSGLYKDDFQSSTFSYNEKITAGFISVQQALHAKVSLLAGLRVEHTKSIGILTRAYAVAGVTNPNEVTRTYTDFFPNLQLEWRPNSLQTFSLGINRRIDRPVYTDLNPFETRLDELTFLKGNPFLKPQYTNTLQLQYAYQNKLIVTLNHSTVKDFIAQVTDSAEVNRISFTKRNLSHHTVSGLNIAAPLQLTKWWQLNANAYLFHSTYQSDFGSGKVVDLSVNAASFSLQQSLQICKGFTVEVNGVLHTPAVWSGTYRIGAMGGLDIGFQKKLLKDKATFTCTVTDIFKTIVWNVENELGGLAFMNSSRPETQQLRFSLSFRFGSKINRKETKRIATEDDKKRISESGSFGN